jgi:hypothetical protein
MLDGARGQRMGLAPAARIHLHWLLAYSDDDVCARREFRSVYLEGGEGGQEGVKRV